MAPCTIRWCGNKSRSSNFKKDGLTFHRRWCVSCLWSTASVVLHRLVTPPLPAVTASKQASKPRQAGNDHLHPEPKVECVVLHTPESPTLDVIFMHGLYGSLGNTWRQGEWKSKYKLDPIKVPLKNHASKPCSCQEKPEQSYTNMNFTYETNLNETELNETVSFKQINGCFEKILPHENSLITEKFYNNTLLNVNNYETQAKFVTDLFKNECDLNVSLKCNLDVNKCNGKCKCKTNGKLNKCKCKINKDKLNKCDVGCGCICDDCYSSCWPKDWIKEDFPGARVISVNYTSDPYLWRPLWVKSCKRLRLNERAEQMMSQLLDLGVGKRPIIWVGHSKGGLFIKEIYCEAYEAYKKINKNIDENKINNKTEDQSNNCNNLYNNHNNYEEINSAKVENVCGRNDRHDDFIQTNEDKNFVQNHKISTTDHINNNNNDEKLQNSNNLQETDGLLNTFSNSEIFGCAERDEVLAINELIDISVRNNKEPADSESSDERHDDFDVLSSTGEGDIERLETRSSLWTQSAGFMFYSVPHRGSPLAAIKTPITARSIELLEISKDCQLVLELQERWLLATDASRPAVRSLVETCRTLMSVLRLRIVSVDSADAGVGSLHGVSVDHREICKPAGRSCLLYTELTDLIRAALAPCQCRPAP